MSYASTVRGFENTLGQRISTLVKTFQENRRRYSLFRQTVRELAGLSDRELADLGLHRSSIDQVALQAAYGKN